MRRQAHRTRSIGRNEWLDSVPDHQAGAIGRTSSSLWLASGSAIAQRWSRGRRCRADARLSLTFGLGSVLASSANRFTVAGCRRLAVAKQSDRPGPDVLARVIEQRRARRSRRGRRSRRAPRVARSRRLTSGLVAQDLAEHAMRLAPGLFPAAARSWSSRRAVRTYQSFWWSWSCASALDRSRRPGRPSPAAASP